MTILIVEDEIKTASYLQKGLTEHGYAVDVAADGEVGLRLAKKGHYDIIILDIALPKRDGWSVLTELRRSGVHTSVLYLTARDAVEHRVRGLNLGADDYLVKPFSFSELLARIQSILRRSPASEPEVLRIYDLEIDIVKHKASRAGYPLKLTAKGFLLLLLLARHPGKVLSRTLIAEQVWDMHFDSDTNVLDVQVHRLRSKVDDAFPTKLIHTVRGIGYKLESPV